MALNATNRFIASCLFVVADLMNPSSAQEPQQSNAAAAKASKTTELPEIDFWYGDRQRFGHLGVPQPLINVLGSIKPVSLAKDARYRLNNGRSRQLLMGSDLHRLARDGDFNLEIDHKDLRSGENTVLIKVRTPSGRDVSRELKLDYSPKEKWKLPFEVDFSKVSHLQDVTQVIDGKWSLTEQGVRTAEPYYDRQLTFGDHHWRDMELRAEIIFHRHFVDFQGRNPNGPPYLSHSHASFNLRWGGHPEDGFLPRRNWQNLGALVALRCDLATPKKGSYWWMHFGLPIKGKPAPRSVMEPENRFEIIPEKRYHYCMRAETLAEGETRYSTKLWLDGEEEPSDWQMSAVDGSESLPSGAVVFVVHHSDVTLCRIKVTSL